MVRVIWNFIQKNLWLPALYTLYFFFQEPVLMLLTWNDGLSTSRLMNAVNATWSSAFMLYIPIAGAVLTGLVYYSYLHSRKKIDLYHSLPVKREKLFASVFIAAFLAYFVPYVGMVLLKVLAALAIGAGMAIQWEGLIQFVLYAMLFYTVALAITALSSQLAGRLITSLCMTAYLMFLPLMVYGCRILLMERFFATFNTATYDTLWVMSRLAMPIRVGAMESYPMNATWVLCYVAAAVILFGLGMFAATRRPSESAGKSAAFKFVEWFVRYPLVVMGTYIFAELMYALNGRVFWYVFGLVMGALITNCILNIIIKGNLRDFFCNKKGFAIVCAFMGVVLLGCIFQPFGYDEYLPRESKVKAVRFHLSDLHNSQDRDDFGTLYIGSDYQISRYNYEAMDMKDGHTDPAVIHAVLNLASACIDSLEDERPFEEAIFIDDYYYPADSRRGIYLHVEYELNSGRKVARYYRLCDEAAYNECLRTLWDMDSIRTENDVLFDEGVDWSSFRAYAGTGTEGRSAYSLVQEEWVDETYYLSLSPSEIPDSEVTRLVAAMKADVLDRDYAVIKDARTVGWVNLMKLTEQGNYGSWNRNRGAIYTRVELLETDVRTLSILNEYYPGKFDFRVNIDSNDKIYVAVQDLNLFTEAGIQPGIAEITALGGKMQGDVVSNIYYECPIDYSVLAPYLDDLYGDVHRGSANPFLELETALQVNVMHREYEFDPSMVGTEEWIAGYYDDQVYEYYDKYASSLEMGEVIEFDGYMETYFFREGTVPTMLMRAIYDEVQKSLAQ